MTDPHMLPVPNDQSDPEHDIRKALTPKSLEFCRFYALYHNAEQSARLAGYNP